MSKQYVYVLNMYGEPLMPCAPSKARKLLKEHRASVVKRTPFTIKLNYPCTSYKQDVTLGVDAGSKHVGISASTENHELYAAELRPRNDVVDNLSTRREFRRARRNRKRRYRAPRFDNRVHSKHKGWLAPSVEVKIQEHIAVVKRICSILPITKVIIETAEFDTQLLKATLKGESVPVGTDYQLGEQYGEYNLRQYILKRDNYRCRICSCSSTEKKPVRFHVHHLESRKSGGNSPGNLVTLCPACHKALHQGRATIKDIRRVPSMRDAAFMGIMRLTLLARLQKALSVPVLPTHGYITKYWREHYGIEKSHINDARMISGNHHAEATADIWLIKPIRHHNRQIHKASILKGGIRKRNQAAYTVKGFRLWDKVSYMRQECFIQGRRATGYFALKTLTGKTIHNGISCKRLIFCEPSHYYLMERM